MKKQGYKGAAFSSKQNANRYGKLWYDEGYDVEGIRSSGPTIENPKKRSKSYYIVVSGRKRKGRK